MKYLRDSLLVLGIVGILVLTILCTGCTQPSPSSPPASPSVSPTATATAMPSPTSTTTSLPYGIAITIPQDWVQTTVAPSGTTDYGRNVNHVAYYVSPLVTPGDAKSSNTLSIDVDPGVQESLDVYFNNATLAVGNTYGKQMQAHSTTLKVGGYQAYELDFQTTYENGVNTSGNYVNGNYIFTDVNGNIYVFAFKGSASLPVAQALQSVRPDVIKSIAITPS